VEKPTRGFVTFGEISKVGVMLDTDCGTHRASTPPRPQRRKEHLGQYLRMGHAPLVNPERTMTSDGELPGG